MKLALFWGTQHAKMAVENSYMREKTTVNLQQNIFEKALLKNCSPHLYASLGTFCVQIGHFFEVQ